MTESTQGAGGMTRRDFVKSAAVTVAGAAALAAGTNYVYAAGSDKIRVGLIGCGKRGTDAVKNCIESAPNVEIAAVADLFKDRAEGFAKSLKSKGDQCKVTPETTFSGFDGHLQLLKTDINVVLICAPPGFRPMHLKAAIEAGKHVFTEKPVGVDPVGIRSVLATSELAAKKNLGIVAGTQRRHQAPYVENLKRIHEGAIGSITAGQIYWVGDYSYYPAVLRQAEWGDMEWQIRNWNYFAWLSGDHIVEQHVHNMDIMCWVMKGPPKKCLGTGGRQQRTGKEFGHIYDHFGVEFEYDGDVRWSSFCRQTDKTANRVSEHVAGTKGMSNCSGYLSGPNTWRFKGEATNPYVQEHTDLIESIRAGKPLNEGKTVAESTLTAIMGRMSAYTGREVNYSWVLKESKLDLTPPQFDLNASLPVPEVAIPGVTQLI